MKVTRLVAVCMATLALAPALRAGEPTAPAERGYKKNPGPYAVADLTADWRDAKGGRDVPVRIYYPKTGEGPFPVVVFSRGLGGSRDGYRYLGLCWASYGYVSVHVQHIGVAGHSFGAWTTLAIAGEVFILPGGREMTLADPRVKGPLISPRGRGRGP